MPSSVPVVHQPNPLCKFVPRENHYFVFSKFCGQFVFMFISLLKPRFALCCPEVFIVENQMFYPQNFFPLVMSV